MRSACSGASLNVRMTKRFPASTPQGRIARELRSAEHGFQRAMHARVRDTRDPARTPDATEDASAVQAAADAAAALRSGPPPPARGCRAACNGRSSRWTYYVPCWCVQPHC